MERTAPEPIKERIKKPKSEKWTHDRFEVLLRDPSPTNDKLQPRESPTYSNL
jgi:hypothetical protein